MAPSMWSVPHPSKLYLPQEACQFCLKISILCAPCHMASWTYLDHQGMEAHEMRKSDDVWIWLLKTFLLCAEGFYRCTTFCLDWLGQSSQNHLWPNQIINCGLGTDTGIVYLHTINTHIYLMYDIIVKWSGV